MAHAPASGDASPGWWWVDDDAAFGRLVEVLSAQPAYALDTEFHRERTYYPRLALLQAAWDGGTAIVDPVAVDVAPLARVLDGPGVAVLHAADQDLDVLVRACGTLPTRLFDTQIAAGFLGFSSPSLVVLVERLLGVRLGKGDRLTDWLQRPLTDGQLRYAASDVDHLLALRALLVDRLEPLGRLAWAEEECEQLRRGRRAPQDPATAWWRIKEARQLRGPSRAVAQSLGAWRERRAAEIDQPVRFVLSDLAVVALAHRQPASADELANLRGVDSRAVRGRVGAEVLAAVREGLALAPDEVRLPPVDDVDRELRPAISLASAWVGQLSSDLRIDGSLLATRGDLQDLVRGETGRLVRGWRAQLLGGPLRQLLGGDAALAFSRDGGLVLEERSRRPIVVDVPAPTDDPR